MPNFAKYRIHKHKLNERGEVIVTKHVGSYWLPFTSRTPEEEVELAKKWGGDELGSPDSGDIVFGVHGRRPRYLQQIVDNLRSSQPNLKDFTDDQIYNAYEDWSCSVDHPDEELIAAWVDLHA